GQPPVAPDPTIPDRPCGKTGVDSLFHHGRLRPQLPEWPHRAEEGPCPGDPTRRVVDPDRHTLDPRSRPRPPPGDARRLDRHPPQPATLRQPTRLGHGEGPRGPVAPPTEPQVSWHTPPGEPPDAPEPQVRVGREREPVRRPDHQRPAGPEHPPPLPQGPGG